MTGTAKTISGLMALVFARLKAIEQGDKIGPRPIDIAAAKNTLAVAKYVKSLEQRVAAIEAKLKEQDQ